MKNKKILVILAGLVVLNFGFCVSAREKTNIECLLKNDNAIDKNVINYSMNFIREQILKYPKVKQYFKEHSMKSFDDVMNNFNQIIESVKAAKEEWIVANESILKDWDNFIKKQEFQNQYVNHIMGEIKFKNEKNVGLQEIEKLEKDAKDFNGEEFKKFSENKKQDIANRIIETKSEFVVLKEMLENRDLFEKEKARFKEVFEKSNYSKENFGKDLEMLVKK